MKFNDPKLTKNWNMAVFLTIIFAWSIQLVMVVGRWLPSGSLSPAFRKDLLNEGQALFVP
ncbi:MAG: hypothetical protein JNN05_09980, partial [Candidatus Omnitrophica bacterium]|nr:hypothetical protein [Candidatus Omnitrophota bacterium]